MFIYSLCNCHREKWSKYKKTRERWRLISLSFTKTMWDLWVTGERGERCSVHSPNATQIKNYKKRTDTFSISVMLVQQYFRLCAQKVKSFPQIDWQKQTPTFGTAAQANKMTDITTREQIKFPINSFLANIRTIFIVSKEFNTVSDIAYVLVGELCPTVWTPHPWPELQINAWLFSKRTGRPGKRQFSVQVCAGQSDSQCLSFLKRKERKKASGVGLAGNKY